MALGKASAAGIICQIRHSLLNCTHMGTHGRDVVVSAPPAPCWAMPLVSALLGLLRLPAVGCQWRWLCCRGPPSSLRVCPCAASRACWRRCAGSCSSTGLSEDARFFGLLLVLHSSDEGMLSKFLIVLFYYFFYYFWALRFFQNSSSVWLPLPLAFQLSRLWFVLIRALYSQPVWQNHGFPPANFFGFVIQVLMSSLGCKHSITYAGDSCMERVLVSLQGLAPGLAMPWLLPSCLFAWGWYSGGPRNLPSQGETWCWNNVVKKLSLLDSNFCSHFLPQRAAGSTALCFPQALPLQSAGRSELVQEMQTLVQAYSFLLWIEQSPEAFP